jgi:hypothetical protein
VEIQASACNGLPPIYGRPPGESKFSYCRALLPLASFSLRKTVVQSVLRVRLERLTKSTNKMKMIKPLTAAVLITAVLTGPLTAFSADNAEKKVKPYPLDKCVVSDEKLGEHGKPYVFTSDNQEVKLCCKDCLSDFKKDKAKYMKKIAQAEKK